MRYVFILIYIPLLKTTALAHPGWVDGNCGHDNRKTGEYHYHYNRCENRPPDAKDKQKIKTKSTKNSTKSRRSAVENADYENKSKQESLEEDDDE